MKKPTDSKKRASRRRPRLPRKLPAVPAGKLPRLRRRVKAPEEKFREAIRTVPRITNETVGEHREEVLASARKYIYPLQHSKHRIVRTSITLLVVVLVAFFVYCGLALYKFQSTSSFIYGVTRVVPFPVAKAGGHWVSYESYLFELRRNMHYYQTQQQADFSGKTGQAQLQRLKEQAMNQALQNSYVSQLAAKYHVSVSDQAVDNEVSLVRAQNRLGSSDKVFKEVLSEFWGWDESDFHRELKEQLLQQAVVAKLDTATQARAAAALKALQDGADFSKVAAQYSDDTATKGNGGQYGAVIAPNDADISPIITAEIYKLKPGQISGVVNTGYTLEIIKTIDATAAGRHAAHIQFTLAPASTYLKPWEAKYPSHTYIHV